MRSLLLMTDIRKACNLIGSHTDDVTFVRFSLPPDMVNLGFDCETCTCRGYRHHFQIPFHQEGIFLNLGQSYSLIDTPYISEVITHQTCGDLNLKILDAVLAEKDQYIQPVRVKSEPFNGSDSQRKRMKPGVTSEIETIGLEKKRTSTIKIA